MADTKNPMQEIVLEKLVINIGIGDKEQLLQNAKALIKKLTGKEAVAALAKKRDPTLGLRKGQAIGAVVTLRKGAAADMLKRALDANNNLLSESSVGENSLSFGIREYIDFTGVKYDPKIGMLGMNVNASFTRRGKRVETRKRIRGKMDRAHRTVKREEILAYLERNYGAKLRAE